MLFTLQAISYNPHTYVFQDRRQKSLLWAGHLIVTLRHASLLYTLQAISYNSLSFVFQDRICLQKSLLWAQYLIVTLRLAS